MESQHDLNDRGIEVKILDTEQRKLRKGQGSFTDDIDFPRTALPPLPSLHESGTHLFICPFAVLPTVALPQLISSTGFVPTYRNVYQPADIFTIPLPVKLPRMGGRLEDRFYILYCTVISRDARIFNAMDVQRTIICAQLLLSKFPRWGICN